MRRLIGLKSAVSVLSVLALVLSLYCRMECSSPDRLKESTSSHHCCADSDSQEKSGHQECSGSGDGFEFSKNFDVQKFNSAKSSVVYVEFNPVTLFPQYFLEVKEHLAFIVPSYHRSSFGKVLLI